MENETAQQLKTIIERIEKLEEEKKALGEDIKEIYVEAKGNGFDPAVIRKVVALRRMDPEERTELEQLVDLYMEVVA